MALLSTPHSVLLCILDGWGETDQDPKNNAILQAKTPNWDKLRRENPHSFLKSWGNHVGLPENQMGNSEVGHMSLGAGQIIMQNLGRINKIIADDRLRHKEPIKKLLAEKTLYEKKKPTLHIAGLFSKSGVHAHIDHMIAFINIMKESNIDIAVHAFLDGRDCAPGFAQETLAYFYHHNHNPQCQIATLCGRYFAMDRDKNWERTKKTFDMIVFGKSAHQADTAEKALKKLYDMGSSDEFAPPIKIGGYSGIKQDDFLMTMNFRADRIRQLFAALADPKFDSFPIKNRPALKKAFSMTPYWDKAYEWITPIFEEQKIHNNLGEVLSRTNHQQFRIAETEKYAHITFFFNGGREHPFPGETRKLIPSPKISSYDLKPEMAAFPICKDLVQAMQKNQYQFLLANFANADMVGHTGNLKAAIKAIEAVDHCLGKLIETARETKTTMLITADHGNAETMWDTKNHRPHTAHTLNLVPLIYYGENQNHLSLKDGILSDIAPTILNLLGIDIPEEMTGRPLTTLKPSIKKKNLTLSCLLFLLFSP